MNALVAQAGRLALAGVDLIQIREKDLPERELEALTRRVTEAVGSFGESRPKVLVNGPTPIAIGANADGVHLRGGAGPEDLLQVRMTFEAAGRRAPIISVSCHSVDDARTATMAGFDYLLLGPIFEKRVQGEVVVPGLGLDLLREVCRLSRNTPPAKILALGGVTEFNAQLCVEAGATGTAGIRMFL